MTSRSGRKILADRTARETRERIGREVLDARLGAGLSQRTGARAVGMSHAQFGRIERVEIESLTIEQATRAAAAVGRRLSVKLYPDLDPVRDAAQLALIERFRARLPPGTRWRTEVLLPRPGDLRSWDGFAERLGRSAAVEAETLVHDVQELDRKVMSKRRDGEVDVVILVISDTRRNRRALAAHREALRGNFPLDGRDVLEAFARGVLPERSGLILL